VPITKIAGEFQRRTRRGSDGTTKGDPQMGSIVTPNTLADFDLCLALAQTSIDTRMEYAWKAHIQAQAARSAGRFILWTQCDAGSAASRAERRRGEQTDAPCSDK